MSYPFWPGHFSMDFGHASGLYGESQVGPNSYQIALAIELPPR